MPWQVGDFVTEGDKPFDQGSFGTIWKARRTTGGTVVALKLVLLTDAADARERIAAERHGAMLQQQFARTHGMVPAVYDVGYDADGHLFIAMELVQGGALSDAIKAGPLDPFAAAAHAILICEFLDKAHGFATTIEGEPYDRLVHADLKPSHVLIDAAGGLKVLDFGIAKALARTTQVTTNNWGTSEYASPERLDRGHVNEHVDFWSLGVILYEMVCGHRPYPRLERNRSQLEHAIRTNAPRAPLPEACPDALAAILAKLLAYQIERRYQTAGAIRSDLARFIAGDVPVAAEEYVTAPTQPIARGAAEPLELPPLPEVPPTDPLPARPAPGETSRRRAWWSGGLRGLARPGQYSIRAAAWFLFLFCTLGLIATEGVAWVAAERFRGSLDAIDARSLIASREDYDDILGRSLLDAGVRLRVHEPLKRQLVALADSVIADYRHEEPTMSAADWRQAHEALRWASRFSNGDTGLQARLLICEGHVLRFAARALPQAAARQVYTTAVEKFRAAAALDARSFDPYLGISRIQVYALANVDEAAAAIEAAEQRGYAPGRRERALLGDGYLRRANASRLLARTLTGEQRRRELEQASADYGRCIEAFDPIVAFGHAARNLEACKRHLQQVDRELEALHERGPAAEHQAGQEEL